jgi:CBS domain-containing protein
MNVGDVMVRNLITVTSDTGVDVAVRLLAKHDISALPVVDNNGSLVGILSEADLMHRVEIGTEKHRPWWLESITAPTTLAMDFTKSHGKKVGELMTTHVVAVTEDASLAEIASLFERHGIKRVPVVQDGHLVGIVSRSNLIQALASRLGSSGELQDSDRRIKLDLLDRMKEHDWTDFGDRNVIVSHGVVHLWGLVGSQEERAALIALAEETPGVTSVADEMIPAY